MSKKIHGLITSFHKGGAERYMLYLLESKLISQLFLLENRIEFETSEIIEPLLPKRKIKNVLIKYCLIPYYAFKLGKKISKGDTVISFVERSDLTNIVSKIFVRHKSIVTMVIDPITAYRGVKVILRSIIIFLYKRFADVIIVDSRGIEMVLEKKFKIPKQKLLTIHNPIDLEMIRQKGTEPLTNKENELFSSSPVFITVGRLTEQKGQRYLLRIFKEVKKEIPTAKLIIIGDGVLRESLLALSRGLNLKTFSSWDGSEIDGKQDVYFLGTQDNPYKFVARSSLFVFTSFFEGFSYVISEALVVGTPAISADCRFGPRETFAPDTDLEYTTRIPEFAQYGILMPVLSQKGGILNDPYSGEELLWVKTLVELCKNDELLKKYVNAGKERVEDFDLKKIISEWNNVIEKN